MAGLGRADLLTGLVKLSSSEAHRTMLAELLGYAYATPQTEPRLPPSAHAPLQSPTPWAGTIDRGPILRFMRATRGVYLEPTEVDEQRDRDRVRPHQTLDLATHVPLGPDQPIDSPSWFPWGVVESQLLAAIGERQASGAVDPERLLRIAARLRPWRRLPRKTRTVWPRRVQLLIDGGPSYLPFFDEMLGLALHVARCVGPSRSRLADARNQTRLTSLDDQATLCLLGTPKASVPTLSLDGVARVSNAAWARAGEPEQERTERLLVAMAPAVRIEAALLRIVAFEHPELGFTAETVIHAWNHPWIDRGTTTAVAWSNAGRREALRRWSARLRADPAPWSLERRALWRIRELHAARYAPSLWYEEYAAALDGSAVDDPIREWLEADKKDASRFYRSLKMTTTVPAIAGWLEAVVNRNPRLLADHAGFRVDGLNPIKIAYENVVLGLGPDELPDEVLLSLRGDAPDLELAAHATAANSRRTAAMWARGVDVRVSCTPESTSPLQASFELGTWPRGMAMAETSWRDVERRTLTALHAENPWASHVGEDAFGVWADVEVVGARFRMRWIPPGTFLMGSPDEDEERYDDEGPQHEVTLTEGFWLADTACTQALWTAVMGNNPSDGGGDDHPVNQVSCDDTRDFLQRMETLAPGLGLQLPTEAQREYACRAGTTAPRYGEIGAIAWYGENSDGRTHPVAAKAPNAWGLYDMLGHVEEWCEDHWSKRYEPGPVVDPSGPVRGTRRVIRGGSWSDGARCCRAAYRFGFGPDNRSADVGFRVSRGQASGPRDAGRSGPAEGATEGARTRASAGLGVSLFVRTDRTELELEPFARPDWAHGVGRDRFGLFADVRPEGWPPEAWLKLRWVAPGTFWMGSPEDEPGRFADEGPRHRVTLTEGFWLADAPCTQALWTTVMGSNPSRFQSASEPWLSHDRPVENVSWDDVQGFFEVLQDALPGAQLPTEAQWEYACRAGAETATYAGPMEIVGDNNAPVLDDIAWYGGNSGVGYELDEAQDSSTWPERQHPHERAGTRAVRTKQPNPWGLYDMLGNVREWCLDEAYRTYEHEPVNDPYWHERGARRVFRGGSWIDFARRCRAAYRYGYDPGHRNDYVGFRVSRGQASRPRDADGSSERSEPAAGGGQQASASGRGRRRDPSTVAPSEEDV